MKIVKKIFFGGNLNNITKDGKPFEHIQEFLTTIEPLIIGEQYYWIVTIEDPSVINR